MIELLHSFGAGIAFAVGVVVGAFLCRVATKEGRAEEMRSWNEHRKQVEERLLKSLGCHERIASVLETLVNERAKR